jgi:hypothetical protein
MYEIFTRQMMQAVDDFALVFLRDGEFASPDAATLQALRQCLADTAEVLANTRVPRQQEELRATYQGIECLIGLLACGGPVAAHS